MKTALLKEADGCSPDSVQRRSAMAALTDCQRLCRNAPMWALMLIAFRRIHSRYRPAPSFPSLRQAFALGKITPGQSLLYSAERSYRCEWPASFFLTKARKWWDDGPMVSPQTPDEVSSSLTPIGRESQKHRIVLRIEKKNFHPARRDPKHNYGKG